MHLSWTAWQTIAGIGVFSIAAIGALVALARFLINQNKEQLREARRVSRELFGVDPDDPDAPKGPSLRIMMGQMIDQTRPLVATVEEHGRRLGKAEAELVDHATRITSVEQALRHNFGSAATGPGPTS